MRNRVPPIVLRYGSAVLSFALILLIAFGIERLFSVSLDPTPLIIALMIATAWYIGRGPGLLVAILFEVAIEVLSKAPYSATFAAAAFNRLVLFISLVLFASSRRSAETRLKQQHELVSVTLSSIGDAVISTNGDGFVTFLNPTAEALTGWPMSEAAGKPLDEVFHILNDETREPIKSPFAAIRDVAPEIIPHAILITRSAEEIPIEESVAPIKDPAGKTIGLIVVFRDVAERRKIELALRQSEQRFARFMNNLPGLAWVKDLQGHYIYANGAAAQAFRTPIAQLLGKTDEELFPPETAAQFQLNDRRALSSEAGVQIIETLQHEDNQLHHSLVTKFPIVGADGKVALIGGMAIDITDRLQSEEALKEADRRKDEFLAMLAHELRNPLAPIRNAAQVLRRMAPPDPQLLWAREVIDRQIQHFSRLIDDLLDVSRITQGKITLQHEPIELSTVILRAVETSRPGIDARHHHLHVQLPDESLRLEGDPTRLEQVIANLLNNAAKYTEDGGEIWVSAERRGDEAVVSVKDTGVGIPEADLPHIFALFAQADRSLDRAQGGLGIGLTLARSLVEMHGGRMEAFSEGPGTGSEFLVWLPVLPNSDFIGSHDSVHEAIRQKASTITPSTTKRGRILVVDDNLDAAESLVLLLELEGHEVRAVHDGPGAIETAQRFRPQVVLLDIGLPGMNGYDVAVRLREEPATREAVLIALTGYGHAEDRQRSKEAGFNHHCTKPVDLEALILLVNAYVTL